MKKQIISIVRWILTMALLYGVYAETGIWTAGALLLVFIMSELLADALNKILKVLKEE